MPQYVLLYTFLITLRVLIKISLNSRRVSMTEIPATSMPPSSSGWIISVLCLVVNFALVDLVIFQSEDFERIKLQLTTLILSVTSLLMFFLKSLLMFSNVQEGRPSIEKILIMPKFTHKQALFACMYVFIKISLAGAILK